MAFFDFAQDPKFAAAMNALMSMGAGFSQAGMPSRTPVPIGAVLGAGAQGLQQGIQSNQALQSGQYDLAGKKLGMFQNLQHYNMIAPYFGAKPLSPGDLGLGAPSSSQSTDATPSPLPSPTSSPAPTPAAQAATGGLFGDLANNLASAPPPTASAAPSSAMASPASPTTPDFAAAMRAMIVKGALGIQPTDLEKAQLLESQFPAGTPQHDEAHGAVMKAAGDRYITMRNGWAYDRFTDQWIHNPDLGPGVTGERDAQGNITSNVVPGFLQATSAVTEAKERAEAKYKPMGAIDPVSKTPINVPLSSLQPDPTATQHLPGTAFVDAVHGLENPRNVPAQPGAPSSADGPFQFLDGTWLDLAKKYVPETKGLTDQQILGLRSDPNLGPVLGAKLTNAYAVENGRAMQAAGVKNIGAPELYLAHRFGAGDATKVVNAPANTPIEQVVSPDVMRANPQLNGMTTGQVYAQVVPAMKGVRPPQVDLSMGAGGAAQPRQQTPGGAQQTPPILQPMVQKPGAPNSGDTPVNFAKSAIPEDLDTFLATQGPNYKPPSAAKSSVPGAIVTGLSPGAQEMAKDDAARVEKYSQQAAEGQKVYTNLEQLYQILGRGLSTGKLTESATNLTNYMRQLGLGGMIPPKFDPSDVNAYNKLATDLVFSQLKALGGQVKVAEIEGLQRANPNTALTPEANVEILHNVLADQMWRDARANLGRQYMDRYGSLGDFDGRFNKTYPEIKLFNSIKDAARTAGWKTPGDPGTPSARGSAPQRVTNPKVQRQISPENIAFTAKQYGVSEDTVKAMLRQRGYAVN